MYLSMFLVAAVAFFVLLWYLRPSSAEVQGPPEWLPRELVGASIAYAETRFRSRELGLVARVDRAYLLGDTLHLMEFKTRARAVTYRTDVVELSVQRAVLESETGRMVSATGWVLVQDREGARTALAVSLMARADVLALKQRYLRLLDGGIALPKSARNSKQCAGCEYQRACMDRYGSAHCR